MDRQVPVAATAVADGFEDEGVREITPDLGYKRLAIVNVVYYGRPATDAASSAEWVLIDAGLFGTAGRIARSADERFGKDTPPVAIILTHGHFDHVGALKDLAERWDVPVYAHELELPFLNGTTAYPPPDPSVGGGLMSLSSPLYPRGPFDFSRWLRTLPADGAVPGMPGWRWIHTPGHAPGHVSLWRAADRTLIAGDAFITTKQESAYAVATQRPELHGPPMYYTPDWESARESVRRLAALSPELVVTGHGRALHGQEMRDALNTLARDFDRVAVPAHGKYVESEKRMG
jgi:glyoxylase-like metal-dependent hydrolase (beta-lactamase superfamily II)